MKILILSNNPLSKDGSNGRTMLNMLNNFSKQDIFNIFISGNNVSLESATFYQINEMKILKNKKPFGHFCNEEIRENSYEKIKNKKRAYKYLIRSIIWSKKSIKKEVLNIAKSFMPDKILIQCGDSDFLIKIACYLSDELNVPLISYNSEDYIFKNWNYLQNNNLKSISFRLFMNRLSEAYDLLYERGKSFVYLTDSLRELYLKRYPVHNSYVIYNSSDLIPAVKYNRDGDIVYCGNLGVGRLKTLIELSKKIFILFDKKIKVYSNNNDKMLLKEINKCEFIEFMGKVSYEECVTIQKKASFILTTESFENYYLKDTQNAFSTKIADALCLGVPLVALVPSSSFVYQYLRQNDCAIVSSSIDDICNTISKMDINCMDQIRVNACKVGKLNHNKNLNSKKFFEILENTNL